MPPPSAIEQLPANIPRLEPNGSNWAIFQMRFKEAMQATRRWGHFNGTKPCPLAADPDNPTADEKESEEKWEHEDTIARYLLSQRLPNTAAVRPSHHDATVTHWAKVVAEYQAKSVYAQNDLEAAFFDMRCQKGGDVRWRMEGA